MMALKCDNCGGYFDFNGDDDITTIRLLNRDKMGNVYSINGIRDKELCPACLAAVMKALEDRKEASKAPESSSGLMFVPFGG